MNLLSFIAFTVFAASTVISPLQDNTPIATPIPAKPDISFGQITSILGETVEATPTPTPIILKTATKSYTIAFLGDSMIDTMGPGLPAVQNNLTHLYPSTHFTLLNYGVGATNIDYGIERITSDYTYLGNHIPSLASTHPDIVVLESFAYNPFPNENGVDRHWLALAHAVDTIHATIPGAKIIIAATIAPHKSDLISPDHKNVIQSYLESTIAFAKSQHLPLADAYHASLDANGDGILSYINSGDHIHYSDSGRALFAKIVVNALQSVL